MRTITSLSYKVRRLTPLLWLGPSGASATAQCITVGIYGYIWVYMGIYGYIWIHMVMFGYLWVYMEYMEYIWGIYVYKWVYVWY